MYSSSLNADRDENVESHWPTCISSDTRHDWWHGIVKLSGAYGGLREVKNYVRAIEQALAEDDERDLNMLDSRGKTALHATVRNRNSYAVRALLECGADINVVDVYGRTPLTCIEIKEHMPMLFYFKRHIEQLIAFGMYVRNANWHWYSESLEYDDVCVGEYKAAVVEKWTCTIIQDIPNTIERCQKSLEKMKTIKINERTTLHHLFYDGAEQLAYSPIKLRQLEEIVKAEDFNDTFLFELGSLLKLVYRRACYRRKILPAVEDALQALFKFELPSPCCEALIKNLNDFDLANVIKAVNMEHDYESKLKN